MEEKSKNKKITAAIISIVAVGAAAASFLYFGSSENKNGEKTAENEATVSPVTSITECSTEAADTTTVITTSTEEFIPPESGSVACIFGTVETESDPLNVRNKPSSDSSILGTLEKGSMVYILGEEDGWYRIEYGFSDAYVSAEYIKVSEYSGTWKERYRKIADDVIKKYADYGFVNFYLKDLDNDNIPELLYSVSAPTANNLHCYQIFSADEKVLYIDKKRYGEIQTSGFNDSTNEIWSDIYARGQRNTAVRYSDGNSSEKSFFFTSNTFRNNADGEISVSMVDDCFVSKSEYEKQYNEHRGTSDLDKYTYEEFISKLESLPESDGSSSDTVVYPVNENSVENQDDFSGDTFDHIYGYISSDKADVPMYTDSSGTERYMHEMSHTILEITDSENGMYKVIYKPEGGYRSNAVEVYIPKTDMYYDRNVSSWKDKYTEIVSLTENANADADKQYAYYYLTDMNSDGIPELIHTVRSMCSDTKYNRLYSVYNGELVSYTIHGSPHFYSSTGCIGFSGLGLIENLELVSYDNGKFNFIAHIMGTKEYPDGKEEEVYYIDNNIVSKEEYYSFRSEYVDDTQSENPNTRLSAAEIIDAINNY